VIKHADWIVDVGPAAGEQGGYVLYSGPAAGLAQVEESQTRRYLFAEERPPQRKLRKPSGWLKLSGVTRNNLNKLDVAFPLGAFTTITGVSGSGKSSLVSQALVELVAEALGQQIAVAEEEGEELEKTEVIKTGGADSLWYGRSQAPCGGRPEGYWSHSAIKFGYLYWPV
jgi:excinuclease ABC subunit A